VPYHIDAITLRTIGDGWHDEMSLGRVTESTFRSINNLLEHLHQSFFFYILMGKLRFVSIGSYLPAAMILAGSFTINALALWVLSGRGPVEKPGKTTPGNSEKLKEKIAVSVGNAGNDAVVVVPTAELDSVERKLALPAITLLAVHLFSFIPLHLLTSLHQKVRVERQQQHPMSSSVTELLIAMFTASPLDLLYSHHN
jgi:glycosylphosphatidylinositol transamidase